MLIAAKVAGFGQSWEKGRSLCGPSFCLELVFGPANAKHSFSNSSDDEDPQNDFS